MYEHHRHRLKYQFAVFPRPADSSHRALAFKCVRAGCFKPGIRLYPASEVYATMTKKTT